eukprot:scaffold75292_cov48-Phaeocystis_antarctica.AAC.1
MGIAASAAGAAGLCAPAAWAEERAGGSLAIGVAVGLASSAGASPLLLAPTMERGSSRWWDCMGYGEIASE